MTDQIVDEDPFAGVDEDFDNPDRDFLEIDDLDGRLVIVFPLSSSLEKSTKPNGKDFTRVVADVVIVDGPTTAKIPHLPFLAKDFYLSAGAVVGAVKSKVGTGRPVLGRVDSRPSSYNKQVKAYGLADAEDKDKDKARPALAKYRAGQFA